MAGMCLACFIFLSVPNNLVEFHPRSFSMSWGLFQLSQQIKEKNSATVSTRSSCISVFGIQHWLTTAYHQQADGLNGWLNQTFYNSSAKFAQENRKTWDVKSNEVVYTFKTAVQNLTKHTPFEARFGRVKSGTAIGFQCQLGLWRWCETRCWRALNLLQNAGEPKMLWGEILQFTLFEV